MTLAPVKPCAGGGPFPRGFSPVHNLAARPSAPTLITDTSKKAVGDFCVELRSGKTSYGEFSGNVLKLLGMVLRAWCCRVLSRWVRPIALCCKIIIVWLCTGATGARRGRRALVRGTNALDVGVESCGGGDI